MRLTHLRHCLTALAFCLPSLLGAQTGSSSAVHYDPKEGLIRLDVFVADQTGKPLAGIGATDFTLLDAGKPVSILTFHAHDGNSADVENPVKIILLIDTLNVPERLASYEQHEVKRFLQQNGGRLAQQVSLVELSDIGLLKVGHPSTDGNALAADLTQSNHLEWIRRAPGGGLRGRSLDSSTSEAAISMALKALGDVAAMERQQPGRKLLLWIGPGWGVGSGAYREEIGSRRDIFDAVQWFDTLLREARVTLYSFSVGETNIDGRALLYRNYLNGLRSPSQAWYFYLYRKVLAVQTGGRVLEPIGGLIADPGVAPTGFAANADLVAEINGCIQEAGTFYTLSFDPSHADQPDEYHDLKVLVRRPGATARTTTGYYDQPYYSEPANAALRPITVEQLKQLLIAAHAEPDAGLARQLSESVLIERLNTNLLAALISSVPGGKLRQAIVSLADASAFLDPPAAEVPTDPAPDQQTQRHMIALTLEYLNKTVPQLPNFYARRTVVNYVERPGFGRGDAKITYQPLHVAGTEKDTVSYRNGYEVSESGSGYWKPKAHEPFLVTYGTFGPLFHGAVDAILRNPGGLQWKRWEQGAGKRLAVFGYQVPQGKSSYLVGACCSPEGDGTIDFRIPVGYHGQITIDPETGAIYRLELIFDLQSTTPLSKSEVLIEYAPVDFGGKSYICPVKSVSISTGRSVTELAETLGGITQTPWHQSFKTYGPYATMLNDITFDTFHLFRADSHLLTGFTPAPQ